MFVAIQFNVNCINLGKIAREMANIRNNNDRRYIQIYTGNGKGKTTAAIGQAVRAAGYRMSTLIIMFMKNYPYSEMESLKYLSEWITVEQYGDDEFVLRKQPPSKRDRDIAHRALKRAYDAVVRKQYDIVILDEICVAAYFNLIAVDEVVAILDDKPDAVELILTGRYCPKEWIDKADLVSEMLEIKHYYNKDVLARKGFES